jgi:hypothetical protein
LFHMLTIFEPSGLRPEPDNWVNLF